MLKIKNNIDLKRLEDFGFRPKYNVDTGKIEKYIKEYTYYGFDANRDYIAISVEKSEWQEGQYNTVEFWQLYLEKATEKSIDLLYDLIISGIVEKM